MSRSSPSRIAASLAEAFRDGGRGAAYEGTLFGHAWGFAPSDIRLPDIYLWRGGMDREIPLSVARELAAELPTCTARFCPQDGHISLIVNHADEILTDLTGSGSRAE